MTNLLEINISKATELIKNAKHLTAFTGAGISVESGIPSYRGKDGLWTRYDTKALELSHFYEKPIESWKIIRKIFYEYFGKASPNLAHKALANMEKNGILKAIITQNIDNLHQEAGSKNIFEFHGNSKILICRKCGEKYHVKDIGLDLLPPKCRKCNEILKPNFIFFGENIPKEAYLKSFAESDKADVFILIGVSGLVVPASLIPKKAKQKGAKIIEINPKPSNYTYSITDIFIQGKAGEVMTQIIKKLNIV